MAFSHRIPTVCPNQRWDGEKKTGPRETWPLLLPSRVLSFLFSETQMVLLGMSRPARVQRGGETSLPDGSEVNLILTQKAPVGLRESGHRMQASPHHLLLV